MRHVSREDNVIYEGTYVLPRIVLDYAISTSWRLVSTQIYFVIPRNLIMQYVGVPISSRNILGI